MPEIINNEGILCSAADCCISCGKAGRILYSKTRDRLYGIQGSWNSLVCPKCDLTWISPRPLPNELPKLYKSYFTHRISDESRSKQMGFKAKTRSAVMLKYGYPVQGDSAPGTLHIAIAHLVRPLSDMIAHDLLYLPGPVGGTLVDIGCGNGDYLMKMKFLGWQVVGVEFDPVSANLARERLNSPIFGSLESASILPSTCDVITMSHVIEHLPDPEATLKECYRLLRPGGRLVVLTPNLHALTHKVFGRYWFGLQPPQHLQIFSRASLSSFTFQAGFQNVRVRTVASYARIRWEKSRKMKRDGALPQGGLGMQRLESISLNAWSFHAIEELLNAMFRNVGEDLVMIATKAS